MVATSRQESAFVASRTIRFSMAGPMGFASFSEIVEGAPAAAELAFSASSPSDPLFGAARAPPAAPGARPAGPRGGPPERE